jgi:hypothetical protein
MEEWGCVRKRYICEIRCYVQCRLTALTNYISDLLITIPMLERLYHTIPLKARKHLGPFSYNSPQRLGVHTQRMQNRWGNLLCANLLGVDGLLQTGVAHKTSHLAIIHAQTTVLCSLGRSCVVARSQVRSDDDIRYGRVFGGIAEALRDQCRAVDDLVDLKGRLLLGQVGDNRGGVGGMVQEK